MLFQFTFRHTAQYVRQKTEKFDLFDIKTDITITKEE